MSKLFAYHSMFFEIVSPRRCLLCSCRLIHPLLNKKNRQNVLGDYLCPVCQEQLKVWVTDSAQLLHIDKVFSGYQYGGALAQIIPAWKYHGRSEFFALVNVLVQQVISRFELTKLNADLVLAIPLSRKSLRKRDFNQALFIASCCAKTLNLSLLNQQFIKVINTQHQASLDREARANNLTSDTFKITRPALVEGRNILLCDDVLTTGSTLKAAAATLKSAGAISVTALTLARVG